MGLDLGCSLGQATRGNLRTVPEAESTGLSEQQLQRERRGNPGGFWAPGLGDWSNSRAIKLKIQEEKQKGTDDVHYSKAIRRSTPGKKESPVVQRANWEGTADASLVQERQPGWSHQGSGLGGWVKTSEGLGKYRLAVTK